MSAPTGQPAQPAPSARRVHQAAPQARPALQERLVQLEPLVPQVLPDLTGLLALRGLALPVLLELPGLARKALLAPPERQALV